MDLPRKSELLEALSARVRPAARLPTVQDDRSTPVEPSKLEQKPQPPGDFTSPELKEDTARFLDELRRRAEQKRRQPPKKPGPPPPSAP
jgi:hypothetical protein